MARPARRVVVTPQQDAQLADLENTALHPKVRLRASILRLHHAGYSVATLALLYGRNVQSIHNDLSRFERLGVAGLADKPHEGRPSKLSGPMHEFLLEQLQQQPKLTAPQLAKAVRQHYGLEVSSETIRSHLYALGFVWQVGQYVFMPASQVVMQAGSQATEQDQNAPAALVTLAALSASK